MFYTYFVLFSGEFIQEFHSQLYFKYKHIHMHAYTQTLADTINWFSFYFWFSKLVFFIFSLRFDSQGSEQAFMPSPSVLDILKVFQDDVTKQFTSTNFKLDSFGLKPNEMELKQKQLEEELQSNQSHNDNICSSSSKMQRITPTALQVNTII